MIDDNGLHTCLELSPVIFIEHSGSSLLMSPGNILGEQVMFKD